MRALHGACCLGSDEKERQLPDITLVDAIRIQRELQQRGDEPIAAERHGRMYASEYGLPSQMLRRSNSPHNGLSSQPASGDSQRRRRKGHSSLTLLRASTYCRLEPCMVQRKDRGSSGLAHAKAAKPPPFPSIAARFENDIALGLAASMWPSGNVVGHCDDRLAHLLVLSSTVMHSARCDVCGGGSNGNSGGNDGDESSVPVELREAFMSVIDHFIHLECVVAREVLLTTPVKEKMKGRRQEQQQQRRQGDSTLEDSFSCMGSLRMSPEIFAIAVEGVARALKGILEPATLALADVAPTWQYSLVRTAADVPNRYDIIEAMACVLRPCRNFAVRRTFCAVARQLALEVLGGAGSEKFGIRGGAAALRILQYINTRPRCLTVEERVAGQRFLAVLERRTCRLRAVLPPNVVDEAIQPVRDLIEALSIFCGPLA